MALEIYNQKPKEKPTKINLVQENGKIYLAVVDEDGNVATSGYIAIVSEAGLKLCNGFDGDAYGVKLENKYAYGCVAVTKE